MDINHVFGLLRRLRLDRRCDSCTYLDLLTNDILNVNKPFVSEPNGITSYAMACAIVAASSSSRHA